MRPCRAYRLALVMGALLLLCPSAFGQGSVRQMQQDKLAGYARELDGWDRELVEIGNEISRLATTKAELANLRTELDTLSGELSKLDSEASTQRVVCRKRLSDLDQLEPEFYRAIAGAQKVAAGGEADPAAARTRVSDALGEMERAFTAAVEANRKLQQSVRRFKELSPATGDQPQLARIEREVSRALSQLQSLIGPLDRGLSRMRRMSPRRAAAKTELKELLQNLKSVRRGTPESADGTELDRMVQLAGNLIRQAEEQQSWSDELVGSSGLMANTKNARWDLEEQGRVERRIQAYVKQADQVLRGITVSPEGLNIDGGRQKMELARKAAAGVLQSPAAGAGAPAPQPASAGAGGTGGAGGGGAGGSQPSSAPSAPPSRPPAAAAGAPGHPAAPTKPEHYGGLQITPQATRVRVGEAVQLRAIDHGGRDYSGASWSGSNTMVLAVSTTGMIVGREVGEAMVMVRVEDMGAILDVVVVGPKDESPASSQPPPAAGPAGAGSQPGATTGAPAAGGSPGATPGSPAVGAQPGAGPGSSAAGGLAGAVSGSPGPGGQAGVASAGVGAAGSGGQAATTPGTLAGGTGPSAAGGGGAGTTTGTSPGQAATAAGTVAGATPAGAAGPAAGSGDPSVAGDSAAADAAGGDTGTGDAETAAGDAAAPTPPLPGLDLLGSDSAAPGAAENAAVENPQDFFLSDLPAADVTPPATGEGGSVAAGAPDSGSLPWPTTATGAGGDGLPAEAQPGAGGGRPEQPVGEAASGWGADWQGEPVEVTTAGPATGGQPGGDNVAPAGTPPAGAADAGWGEGWQDEPVVTTGGGTAAGGSGAGSGVSGDASAGGAADSGWGADWAGTPVEVTTSAGTTGSGSSAGGEVSGGADSGWAADWQGEPVVVTSAGGASPGAGTAEPGWADSGRDEPPVEAQPGPGISALGVEAGAATISAPPPSAPTESAPGRGGDPLAGDWMSAAGAPAISAAEFNAQIKGYGPCANRPKWVRFAERLSDSRNLRACALKALQLSQAGPHHLGRRSGVLHLSRTQGGYSATTLEADRGAPAEARAYFGAYGYIHQKTNGSADNIFRGKELMRLQRVGEGRYAGQCFVAKQFDGLPSVWTRCTLEIVSEGKALLSLFWQKGIYWVLNKDLESWTRLGGSAPPIRFSGLLRIRGGSAGGQQAASAATGSSGSGNCWVGCKPAVRPLRCAVACDGQFNATTSLARGGHTDYRLKNATWERCAAKMRELGQQGW